MNRKTFSVRALALLGAFGLSALTLGSAPAQAQAQAFPTKPVSLMVPYPAGGLSDAIVDTHFRAQAPQSSFAVAELAGGRA